MERPLFSIITVTLNAGDKLFKTVESCFGQTCRDFEVIVKDGGSRDDSVTRLKERQEEGKRLGEDFWSHVRIIEQPDSSIYEGMNQAAGYAAGQFFYFLNCGDTFYDKHVLTQLQDVIQQKKTERPRVFYGDIYDALRSVRVASNPRINGFACYRNVPCHQACLYERELFAQRGYDTGYRVRADYEHFLWCFYEKKARIEYVPVVIAAYEGGGFSETKESRICSRREHREITVRYMSAAELFCYRAALALTLAPLRTWMAESPVLSGGYNRLKRFLYGRKA